MPEILSLRRETPINQSITTSKHKTGALSCPGDSSVTCIDKSVHSDAIS